MPVRRAENLHDTCQLLLLVLTREDRVACPKLRENAAETPHINPQTIATAQNNLRASIKARLDVRVHLLLLPTTRPKIDNADVGFARFAEEDVLGLEVAVDNAFGL
jgi:hypothetical protein